jgi:FtsZ-binding cell division protein ZapB
MTILSISAAARSANVSRQTIHTYINTGKITTQTDNKGNKVIDTAELLRVFGELHHDSQGMAPVGHSLTPDLLSTIALLEKEVQLLREQLFKAEQREQQLNQHIERLTAVGQPQKQIGWFGRLLGR